MRALTRWALADLRTHRGQAVSLLLATGGITAALLISVALLVYAADPWQRLFAATRGAHVWMRVDSAADTSALSGLDGVTAVSGPFRTVSVTVSNGPDQAVLDLRAAGATPPAVGRPEIDSGRWLNSAPGDGIVLEKSLATALWVEPGDRISLPRDGAARSLRVVGIAETAEPAYTDGDSPGIGWADPEVVDELAFRTGDSGKTLGLRLADPGDTGFVVQRAVAAVGPAQVVDVSTWQDARADAEGDNHLRGLLVGLFGLGALLAAAIAVTGGVGARVLAHARDISVLKAIGFTPGQVVAMFLLQHVFLAVLGVLCGVAATEVLGPLGPGSLSEAMEVWRALPEHTWTVPAVSVATTVVIASATTLAAWRAGRVPSIPAARTAAPGRRRMSGAARVALRAHIPPALVLGARAVLHRPGRSAAVVLRLALPILIATVAFATWATVDRLEHSPGEVGLAGQLIVRPNGVSDAVAVRSLDNGPGVAAVHPGIELAALAPGQSESVTLRGLGTAALPYPFAVVAGRAPTGPGEAVAGQGLLDALDVSVGQWVRLTVGGTPHILHIVGRCIETEDNGRVISTTYDTLHAQDTGITPAYYSLELRDGEQPGAVGEALARSSHGTLEIRSVTGSAPDLSPVRGVIVGLVVVLSLIGLAELSTAVFTSVRDHSRDLRAYRAVGLMPHQAAGIMVAQIGLLALAAAVLGIGLGVPLSSWLIDLQGGSSGLGAGIARPPSRGVLSLLACVSVGIAAAACVLPATRSTAARGPRDMISGS
ncbi:FtsX-like permease family protein [Streptomyces sp. AK02-01A]|uniref:FtsX-like permease family protein n=1 Tax=Streptomyces sp. AK02-01A TaxID=3028648 RepID=UPI0029B83647|nr:FtsX-like permease family protein [Streptomyces sp. AK02-01A]MDX3853895.1 FtsX-like permease family protein [Streptomyces sp. AK02-01A]